MPRRAAIPLVPKQVAAYAPRAYKYDISDAVCPGLNLRVSPNGSKAWRYFYRDAAGTLRRMTLGHWPAMTLKDAREEGFEKRRALECDGVEPLEAKRTGRADAQASAESTVAVLWEHYAEVEGRRLKSWHERQRQFDHDIRNPFADRPINSLTRGELRAWLDAKARTAPVRANANYRTMRRFLQFLRPTISLDTGLRHDAARRCRGEGRGKPSAVGSRRSGSAKRWCGCYEARISTRCRVSWASRRPRCRVGETRSWSAAKRA
jgi:hypothetical protein